MEDELLKIFAEEAGEIVDALESGLLELEGSPGQESINQVFRAAHTMKGNAGLVGFTGIAELTHGMEGVLDQMRKGQRQPDAGAVKTLLQATDALKAMLAERLAGREPAPPRPVMQALQDLLRPGGSLAAAAEPAGEAAGEPGSFRPLLQVPPPVNEYPRPPSPEAAPPPASPEDSPAPKGAASATVRVGTDKLDHLVDLVGELTIGVARVKQLRDEEDEAMTAAVEALELISSELQDQVLKARMLSVESTFRRFHRMVHDLAAEEGKNIRLRLSGAETELDKNVIEKIADPLKHMIRNSIDHGLETPVERLAAGKPEQGSIWLRAFQEGGKIIIEVADDGRGIDPARVWDKAVEQGLAPPGEMPSPGEVLSFLFQPGFSTSAEVTELSGRGVGLDVVRQNIEALRGTVEVRSQPGQGTTFVVKLPLTLAIIDGMTVQVGEEVFTLPMLSVIESLRPRAGEVTTLEGQSELFDLRGEYLPLVRLYQVLELPPRTTEPTEALVVVVESVSRRFALMVDAIVDEQQAVIKSLERNYKKVEGVAGATILGDGRVSLILDVYGLERLSLSG